MIVICLYSKNKVNKMAMKLITLRISEELDNMLTLKAISVNKNRSDYLRDSISKSNIAIDTSKDIKRLIGSINKVGNNINQIAHNLNIANKSNKLNDVDYNNIKDELTIIEHQLIEVLKGM